MFVFPFGRARLGRVAALALGLVVGVPVATDGLSSVGGRLSPQVPVSPAGIASPAPPPACRPEPRGAEDGETPARVEVGPGGRDLILAGDLTEGVAARVAAVLAAHPRVTRLQLTSDGGLVDEAKALGQLVAARGLTTYVPEVCASACTLVFAHGRRRALGVGAQLGFHAPYEVGPDGRMQAVDPAPERAAYRAAGLPRAFVARVMTVPPSEIWVPAVAELRAAGIVTEVVAPGNFLLADVAAAQTRRTGHPRPSRRRIAAPSETRPLLRTAAIHASAW
jgi:hypothetical protein